MDLRSLRRFLPGWREDDPEAFLRSGRRAGVHTVVACVGDSNTQGQFSANYVALLDRRLGAQGYQFINAGVNGNMAFNIANRLDAILACRPDVVTLMVGTNDVNARFDATWEARYRRDHGLPVAPTLAFYRESVAGIVARLQAETRARLALIEIPMLGEDLDSRSNGLVRAYNTALREIADQAGIPCLPLYERLVALFPPGHTPPPYTGDFQVVARAGLSAMLLRRSWDEISRRNGLAALTDHLHLNDRAAAEVAALVEGFVAAGA